MVVDTRFQAPPTDSPVFLKIACIGYGIFALAMLTLPHKILFKPSQWTTIFPNLCLLVGLVAPFCLMQYLAIPGEESASPFDSDTVTGHIAKDPFCIIRLLRWYNYQAVGNPIGGPIINGFAILGMLFASKCGNFRILCGLSFLGCAFLHLKWVYESPVQSLVLDQMDPAAYLKKLWQDTMVEQNKTPGFTDPFSGDVLHEGKMGYMPASYTTDYLGMIGVAVVYAVFEARNIVESIKTLLITALFGGAAGLIYVSSNSLLGTETKKPSILCCVVYLAWAAFCVYDWLPFQMNWIDFAITPDGRLGGGLINLNVKYCTMSVIAPYFALCGISIAHYTRQPLPTLQMGVLFFNSCAFLFFHIAAATAIMMGMSCFWGAPPDPAVAESLESQPLVNNKNKKKNQ